MKRINIKKLILLSISLLLCGCLSSNNGSNSESSNDDSVSLSTPVSISNPISNSDSSTSIPQISNSDNSTSAPISNNESSTSDSIVSNVCDSSYRPGGTNPDGSNRLPIPCNKENKVKIGSDNASMTTFDFTSELPDDFRFIYGNNFTNPPFYAESSGGGLKISSATNAKQGFQTAMFTTNLKLEIRINIGGLFDNSHGNQIDKDKPVLVIYGFDENGNYLRSAEIDTITKANENSYVRVYMDGNDVSYLEVRALQFPYKGSQAYNLSIKGLSLIAWPYPL